MANVRWGILGAAKFARQHMGRAIQSAEGAELVAVASRDPSKVAPFQTFAPACRAMGYEALLAAPDIDAVYIPLPHHLHVEWALKAAAAGKHVLVEKPAAMHVAQFDDLIAARDRSGQVIAEAYMIVHHPQWHRTKALIEDGAIGRLRHISGHFTYENSADTGNFRNKAEAGGGGLRDIGVYTFGSARYVMGAEPEITQARLRFEDGFDSFADVQARFGDVTYSAYVSTRLLQSQEMVFHGTQGRIRLPAPFNPGSFKEASIEIEQPNFGTRLERFPGVNHYVLQVEAFCRAVTGQEDYACPLEFSRGTQDMIDRVLDIGTAL